MRGGGVRGRRCGSGIHGELGEKTERAFHPVFCVASSAADPASEAGFSDARVALNPGQTARPIFSASGNPIRHEHAPGSQSRPGRRGKRDVAVAEPRSARQVYFLRVHRPQDAAHGTATWSLDF